MNLIPWVMRLRLLIVALVAELAVVQMMGCAVGGAGRSDSARRADQNVALPSWAKHVQTTNVNTGMPFDQAAADIVAQLRAPQLAEVHMPAEQIALAAMQSLEAGHRSDAALLLAIASYRYRQQAERILEVGFHAPPGVDVNYSAYYKLRAAEEVTYERLGFGDELRVTAAWLRGEEALEVDADLMQRLDQLVHSRPVDEETFREAIRQRLPITADPSPETPQGAALAEGFLARLRLDAADKRKHLVRAAWAMSQTPLPAFQLEALRFASLPVSPRFCSPIADQLGAHRAAVAAMLSDPRDATRAAAAVVLGMNPMADQIPPLERMWETERQPLVRQAVAYALARHGKRERVRDLVASLDGCVGDSCLQALSLLDFLPRDILLNVAEGVPAAFAVTGRDWPIRFFAVAVLSRMTLEHSLGAASRAALFTASHDRHRELSRAALEAIASDTGLGRNEVIGRLGEASPDFPPLLARLAVVATEADLPLLRGLMPRFARVDGPQSASLVEAAARVPGPAAEALLLAWFDAHPPLRAQITLRMLERRPSSMEALGKIAGGRDSRAGLMVRLALGTPDALGALDRALRASDPNDRLFAARLAGIVRAPGSMDGLWQLVNVHDDRYYPEDALIRHQAMASLLWIALAAHRPPPRPAKTLATATAIYPSDDVVAIP
jgi:hypothetical protein